MRTLATACLFAFAAAAPAADDVVHLFNGKDLTHFYTYLGAQQGEKDAKPYGKNNDPKQVFTVRDGAIRVSGEVWGCFTTEKEYGDYRLIVEFKWGEKTWASREKASRDSGILLHCQGGDGTYGVWQPSYECQMIEGGTGDFLVLSNKEHQLSLTVESRKKPVGAGEKKSEQPYYEPGAEAVVYRSGRINWFARDPKWADVKGFRGPMDVEKPVGEWNRLECVCDGDRITNILNGTVVNAGRAVSHRKGKILFQSEGAEVFFRKIDLELLKK